MILASIKETWSSDSENFSEALPNPKQILSSMNKISVRSLNPS